MADIQILAAESGDWIGIYKDGVLIYEGHSIEPRELLELIDISHDYQRLDFAAQGWDRCPPQFPEMERGM